MVLINYVFYLKLLLLSKTSKNIVNYIKVLPNVLEIPDDLKQGKNSFIKHFI